MHTPEFSRTTTHPNRIRPLLLALLVAGVAGVLVSLLFGERISAAAESFAPYSEGQQAVFTAAVYVLIGLVVGLVMPVSEPEPEDFPLVGRAKR